MQSLSLCDMFHNPSELQCYNIFHSTHETMHMFGGTCRAFTSTFVSFV